MAKKKIKFRLFHYYTEKAVAGQPAPVLIEQNAFFGEEVEIPREEDLQRGEELGAFFTDKEMKQLKEGTFEGPELERLHEPILNPPFTEAEAEARGIPSAAKPSAGARSSIDARSASSDELAEYIAENKLNAQETIALAQDDPELAEKLLDAEAEVAASNDADTRKTVDDGLQKIIDRGAGGDEE